MTKLPDVEAQDAFRHRTAKAMHPDDAEEPMTTQLADQLKGLADINCARLSPLAERPDLVISAELRDRIIAALEQGERGKCVLCGGFEWVCEGHRDKLFEHGCGGAGEPCPLCRPEMAAAGFVEPWRQAALAANKIAWMASEWMEHTGSGCMLDDEYRADIARADACFKLATRTALGDAA